MHFNEKHCCEKCFEDQYVKDFIIKSGISGEICSYCGSIDVSVLGIGELSESFSKLLVYYKESEPNEHYDPHNFDVLDLGSSLWELVQEDWNMFSELTDEKLLYDIINYDRDYLSDGHITGLIFFSRPGDSWMHERAADKWDMLARILKHKNRYFPSNIADYFYSHDYLLKQLEYHFTSIITTVDPNDEFFRARIGEFEHNEDLNAPPEDKILKSGRANPVGIRVLYSAIDIDTAIAEVRPWKSATVTIASVKPTQSLKLVDLSKTSELRKKVTQSFFSVSNMQEQLDALDLLLCLDEALSKPVFPDVSELEYIPSQYLTEFIKSLGYDGVIFRSSLGPGENYVFFNWEKFHPLRDKLEINIIKHFEVNGLKYDFSIKQ